MGADALAMHLDPPDIEATESQEVAPGFPKHPFDTMNQDPRPTPPVPPKAMKPGEIVERTLETVLGRDSVERRPLSLEMSPFSSERLSEIAALSREPFLEATLGSYDERRLHPELRRQPQRVLRRPR
jgi:hypothetical protein